MTKKILIMDDDPSNLELLLAYLQGEDLDVDTASDGAQGLAKLRAGEYNLVLLDIMMPIIDGHEFIRQMRKTSDIPVIFITARDSQMDINKGFLLGCDDYLIKPFDLTELRLRINALLKRASFRAGDSEPINKKAIQYKDIVIDASSHEVLQSGNRIDFTSKEFKILLLLFSNTGRVFSAKEIYEKIWEEEYFINDRSVLTHIGNIREKLDDSIKKSKYITTIWGVGYKVEKETNK